MGDNEIIRRNKYLPIALSFSFNSGEDGGDAGDSGLSNKDLAKYQIK